MGGPNTHANPEEVKPEVDPAKDPVETAPVEVPAEEVTAVTPELEPEGAE